MYSGYKVVCKSNFYRHTFSLVLVHFYIKIILYDEENRIKSSIQVIIVGTRRVKISSLYYSLWYWLQNIKMALF